MTDLISCYSEYSGVICLCFGSHNSVSDGVACLKRASECMTGMAAEDWDMMGRERGHGTVVQRRRLSSECVPFSNARNCASISNCIKDTELYMIYLNLLLLT